MPLGPRPRPTEWAATLEDAGVPVGEVGDIGTDFAYARSLGLDSTVQVGEGHPDQVRHPITYSSSKVRPPTAQPMLGQHNDEIRRWLAGETENP